MNGPEHYAAAEQLGYEAAYQVENHSDWDAAQAYAAMAQVHATLALIAAQTAPAVAVPQLETEPAVAYVYRAAWGMDRLGTYTNQAAARTHCEDDASNHNPGFISFDWLGDESEPDSPYELVMKQGSDEQPTEYTVTRIEVAADYDPEADA